MGTGICYVFGGGERTDCTITFEKEDLVIAADAGFDYLNDLGFVPMWFWAISILLSPMIFLRILFVIQRKKMIPT
ncbi:MAG: hypothetical protein ACLSCU_04415 [Eubacterium sp.]